jgi:hypothetical protein
MEFRGYGIREPPNSGIRGTMPFYMTSIFGMDVWITSSLVALCLLYCFGWARTVVTSDHAFGHNMYSLDKWMGECELHGWLFWNVLHVV